MTRQTATSGQARGIERSDARTNASSPTDLSAGTGGENGRPLLLGHRGARLTSRFGPSSDAAQVPPENTLACFEYALDEGCDGFEFDVRITRDARLVICHNAWLGGCKVSTSLFETLRSRSGLALTCLEEVLEAFGDRAYLDIEVKVAGGEELIAKALGNCRPRCGYLVSSFLPEVLHRLHEIDPTLPLGYLCDRSSDISRWRNLPVGAFLPHHTLITQAMADEVHERGLQVLTWTVNLEPEQRRLAAWGVDGVISDDPGLLSRVFSGPREKRAAKLG